MTIAEGRRKCPHERIEHCPLYWASHDPAGLGCIVEETAKVYSMCAVDHGESYDKLAARITTADFCRLRGFAFRWFIAPGEEFQLHEFKVRWLQ